MIMHELYLIMNRLHLIMHGLYMECIQIAVALSMDYTPAVHKRWNIPSDRELSLEAGDLE